MSLAMEMAVVSAFALIASIIFYVILSIATEAALNKMFDTEKYIKNATKRLSPVSKTI